MSASRLLYPQERTFAGSLLMSALGQQQKSDTCPSGLLCARIAHLGEEEFGLAVRHQGYPHCRRRYHG
jgi:hypothetical protein